MTAAPPAAGPQVVLTITHRHGDDITVHAGRAEAMGELAAFARRSWRQIPAVPGGPPQDDAETIRIYFARQPLAAELARGRQLTEPGDGFTEITTQCCHRFAVRLGDVAGQTITCQGQNPKTFAPCGMPLAIPAAAESPIIWVRWGHRQHGDASGTGRGNGQP